MDYSDSRKKRDDQKEAEVAPHWRINTWFPKLTPEVLNKLKIYHTEMIKFNSALNLISAKTVIHSDVIHVADSVLACQLVKQHIANEPIYDFGSGNGFPGLVFAILYPENQVILVDSDQRKSEFLKHCVTTLGLKNVSVKVMLVENIPANSVKYAMSRGFASVSKALLTSRKCFLKGGVYFHLKSEEWATEVADIPTQLCSHWHPSLLGQYKLPIGEVKFSIVRTDKVGD